MAPNDMDRQHKTRRREDRRESKQQQPQQQFLDLVKRAVSGQVEKYQLQTQTVLLKTAVPVIIRI